MGRIVAGCCGSGSGGVPSGTTAVQMWTVEDEIQDISDGVTEVVIWQWAADLTLLPASLMVSLSAFGQVDADSSTIRVRIGGTRSVADGTVIVTDTVSSVGAFLAFGAVAGPFVNPGGLIPVKVTCLGFANTFTHTLLQGLSLVMFP